jgi:aminoglycoside N3'-acetyltransferase
MREHPLMDPLLPVKKMLKGDSHVLAIGVGFDSVTAIHLAEERKTPSKMEKQLALAMTSRGQVWVEVLGLGCSNGFTKLKQHVAGSDDKATMIGLARAELYSMKSLVDSAEALLSRDPMALACDRDNCLSCALAAKRA